MLGAQVVRMWITNKNHKEITAGMIESMEDFLCVAIQNGCIGSTFAEDEERIIVYTGWVDEMTLEQFRLSEATRPRKGASFNHLLTQVSKFPKIYCLTRLQKFCLAISPRLGTEVDVYFT